MAIFIPYIFVYPVLGVCIGRMKGKHERNYTVGLGSCIFCLFRDCC